MVLAAGLGTRLQPLTADRPKALVEIAGHTLLELTLARLKSCGIVDVIINTHHFADQVASYLSARTTSACTSKSPGKKFSSTPAAA
jgi:N-acetyl-alpha-D-muramate 1-phosphate uridylyltransferase